MKNLIQSNKILAFLVSGVVLFTLLASYFLFQESFKRTELKLREVTLYDTSVTSYKVKSNTVVNTKGYFLDKETKLTFTAPIQDTLYREFQEGKNKQIAIQREFNLDTIENKSDGPLLKFLGSVLIILLVGSAGSVIIINQQSKTKT
jgi:hypothetical protein